MFDTIESKTNVEMIIMYNDCKRKEENEKTLKNVSSSKAVGVNLYLSKKRAITNGSKNLLNVHDRPTNDVIS